ncbi:MAG: hypothetical protein AAB618_02045 [Patescibacteria group bacterium]
MSQGSDKIIIELFGLPGVGKSTLGRLLKERHGVKHITATSVTRAEYLGLFLRYPRSVMAWLVLIIKNYHATKSLKHLRYNAALLFVAFKKIHQARLAETSTVVDEGLLQRFLSYSDILLTRKQIEEVIKLSPRGTVIICVNDRVVEKDRYDQAHDRGSQGSERLERWRSNMATNIATLVTVLKETKSEFYFETATTSIDDIIKQINI